jgi:hypothetical protein
MAPIAKDNWSAERTGVAWLALSMADGTPGGGIPLIEASGVPLCTLAWQGQMVEIRLCDQTFELILQRQSGPARIAFAQLMSTVILDLAPVLISFARQWRIARASSSRIVRGLKRQNTKAEQGEM